MYCNKQSSSAWNYLWVNNIIDRWNKYQYCTHKMIINQNAMNSIRVTLKTNVNAKFCFMIGIWVTLICCFMIFISIRVIYFKIINFVVVSIVTLLWTNQFDTFDCCFFLLIFKLILIECLAIWYMQINANSKHSRIWNVLTSMVQICLSKG